MFNSSLAFWTKKSCKKRTMKDESSLFLPYKAEKYLRVKQCKITTQDAEKSRRKKQNKMQKGSKTIPKIVFSYSKRKFKYTKL